MNLFYEITIWLFFAIGILHAGFAFRKYRTVSEEALWFFSATLGILFCSFVNLLNLYQASAASRNLSIISNVLLLIFFAILAFKLRKPTMVAGFVSILLLLAASILSAFGEFR